MATVYELARAVEEVTGLEGYDPQLGEPVSDVSDTSPTRRRWADDDEDDDERGPAGRPRRPVGRVPRPRAVRPRDVRGRSAAAAGGSSGSA